MIADHYWCRRREVLLVEVRDLSVPALLARLRVERNEIVVRRLEEQPVAVHRHATIADVRAPARLPPVVPENMPVQRVHRPRIVGRRDVEDAVHLQNRSRQTRRSARRSRHGHRLLGYTAGDGGRPGRWAEPAAFAGVRSGRQAPHPGEGQVPNVGLVDLSEGAVPALRIVARIGRPRARRQPLAYQRPVRQTERNQKQQRGCLHFNVTRYAVRSWMSASRHRGSLSMCHCNGLVTTTFGIESCRAKLWYVPAESLSATTKAER